MGMAKAEKDGKDLSEVIQAGLDMIQKRGKAVPGEKTMVDVWSGIPVSLQSGDLTHEKIGSLVEATKDLKATYTGSAGFIEQRVVHLIHISKEFRQRIFTHGIWVQFNLILRQFFH